MLTFMEVLAALSEQPRLPTKLAQICNINYVRLREFLAPLETKGYVKKQIIDGHEVIAITSEGLALHLESQELKLKFPN